MRCVTALRDALSRILCKRSIDESDINEFKRCCEVVAIRRAGDEIDDADFLKLYGYFKQAIVGDFNIKDTSDATESDLLKWTQWKKHKGMSKKEAMRAYINLVRQIYGHSDKEDTRYATVSSSYSRLKLNNEDVSDEDEGMFTLVAENHLGLLQMLLTEKPWLLSARTSEGLTALHIAADRGHLSIAKCLISHGADVNAVDNHGETPLFAAMEAQHHDMVALLQKAAGDQQINRYHNDLPIGYIIQERQQYRR
ncbi:ankyrin repeat containing protein [Babesia divergens]|uniref:Ankyrin repeat containing protein n=1 Tax=Babesia divergens TaxID=32595 RepID=A0AAD9LHV9_BABDI|nr:ankyrin repeat containing protein [Babesia divergens]